MEAHLLEARHKSPVLNPEPGYVLTTEDFEAAMEAHGRLTVIRTNNTEAIRQKEELLGSQGDREHETHWHAESEEGSIDRHQEQTPYSKEAITSGTPEPPRQETHPTIEEGQTLTEEKNKKHRQKRTDYPKEDDGPGKKDKNNDPRTRRLA